MSYTNYIMLQDIAEHIKFYQYQKSRLGCRAQHRRQALKSLTEYIQKQNKPSVCHRRNNIQNVCFVMSVLILYKTKIFRSFKLNLIPSCINCIQMLKRKD